MNHIKNIYPFVDISGLDLGNRYVYSLGIRVWEDHGGEEAPDYRDIFSINDGDDIETIAKNARKFAERLEKRFLK